MDSRGALDEDSRPQPVDQSEAPVALQAPEKGRLQGFVSGRSARSFSETLALPSRLLLLFIIAFPAAVADYQSGKQAAIGRLIGETIKRTGGRANPDTVRLILQEELSV